MSQSDEHVCPRCARLICACLIIGLASEGLARPPLLVPPIAPVVAELREEERAPPPHADDEQAPGQAQARAAMAAAPTGAPSFVAYRPISAFQSPPVEDDFLLRRRMWIPSG